MNTYPTRPTGLFFIIIVNALLLNYSALAQTFTTVHVFAQSRTNLAGCFTNSEGAHPSSLMVSGNSLYVTAQNGGNDGGGSGDIGNGSVIRIQMDGTGLTNLYTFSASPAPGYANTDGANPSGTLFLLDGRLFGAAIGRAAHGNGTLFAINTNGTAFSNAYSFSSLSGGPAYANPDGANPNAGVVISGNTMYGIAYNGGAFGGGSVFRVNTNGTSFTNLHSFAAINYYPNNTNSDGARPGSGTLVLSGATLYGTASDGGTNGSGTIFAVNTNGTGFRLLHVFTALSSSAPYGNTDGSVPTTGLVLSGNTLYGTALGGGTGGSGTVFSINTNGTGFTTLYSFAPHAVDSTGNFFTNSDGMSPKSLILSGSTIYGVASQGAAGSGAVFRMNTNGGAFAILHAFQTLSDPYYLRGTNSDGANPSSLVLAGNTLYGTTSYGATTANGTIFSINLALNLQPNQMAHSSFVAGKAVLTYLGAPGSKFALESTHSFGSQAGWTALATNTTTPDGYVSFTNTLSAANDFYRIRSVP